LIRQIPQPAPKPVQQNLVQRSVLVRARRKFAVPPRNRNFVPFANSRSVRIRNIRNAIRAQLDPAILSIDFVFSAIEVAFSPAEVFFSSTEVVACEIEVLSCEIEVFFSALAAVFSAPASPFACEDASAAEAPRPCAQTRALIETATTITNAKCFAISTAS